MLAHLPSKLVPQRTTAAGSGAEPLLSKTIGETGVTLQGDSACGVHLEDQRTLSSDLQPIERAEVVRRLNTGGGVERLVVGDFAEIVVEVGGHIVPAHAICGLVERDLFSSTN